MDNAHKKSFFSSTEQSIRSKLIITFIVIALGPLCLMSWLSFQYVSRTLEQNAHIELQEISSIAKQFSNIWFTDHIKNLSLLNEQDAHNQANKKLLTEHFIQSHDFVNKVHIIENPQDRPIQVDDNQFSDISTDHIIAMQAELEKGKSSVFRSIKAPQQYLHIIALPVRGNNNHLNTIVLVEINLQGLLKSLSTIGSNNQALTFYIIKNGWIENSTPSAKVSQLQDFNINSAVVDRTFSFEKQSGYTYYGVLTDLDFLDSKGWQLLVEKPTSVFSQGANNYKKLAIWANALALLAILLLSWWFARRLSRPLITLAKATEEVTLGTRATIPILTDSSELHRLSLDLAKLVTVKAEQQNHLSEQSHALQVALKQLAEQKIALDEHAIAAVTDTKDTIAFVNSKDRKEIESQLQLNQDRFASLVGNIPGIVYRCKLDKKRTMLYMSEQTKSITGYHPDDLVENKQLSFVDLIHPEDAQQVEEVIYQKVEQHLPWSVEYRLIANNGTTHWVHEKAQAVYDAQGNVIYLDGFILDITEQYNTQVQLYRQQSLLESMSKQGKIGAWEVDLDQQTIYWSDEVKVIHGVEESYQPELSQALNFYKQGESRDKISELFDLAVNEGKAWDTELLIVTQQGKDVWVRSMGQADFIDKKCVRVYGSFQDIHDYKILQLEREKASGYNKHLASLTVSPEVLSGDFEKVKDIIAQSMTELLGVDRASVWIFDAAAQEMHCYSLYHKGQGYIKQPVVLKIVDYPNYYRYMFEQGVIAAVDVNKHPAIYEMIEGYTKPLGITSMLDAVISTGEGILGVLCAEQVGTHRVWSQQEETYLRSLATLVGSVIIAQRRKKTAEELKFALIKSNDAATAKSQFLATMSHEIRTPMNGVLGMLELIQLEPLSKPVETKVGIAKNSAHSLLSVINDILDFSKIEAGKIELETINFNARDLIGEIAESQALKAQEKDLEVILDLVAINPSEVKGDPGRIRQVLTNLLSNAIKFTAHGDIIISASMSEAADNFLLSLKVKDSGIGIDKTKQSQLFSPFSQVDASTTREYGGSGLGLAISKQLCEIMGGTVTLQSEVGVGSEFTATFMLEAGSEQERSIPKADMSKLTVLVVDDNETNRIVISQQLQHWGAKVEVACDGYTAISLCNARVAAGQPLYDIAVLDMQMPQMDGITLCRKLKSNPQLHAMPLVMMTSIAGMEGAQRYNDAGFQAYFAKPITTADLISALAVITAKAEKDELPLVTSSYISSLRTNNKNKKLLLVEDNPINQQVSTLMLAKLDYQVMLAENGQRAIEILKETEKDEFYLVLMDCQMPIMDGFDATRAIRQGRAGAEHQDITIIALTANAMDEDKEQCLAAGMNDYLSKPIQLQILKDKLEQY